MNIQQLNHDGVSISEIGSRLNLARKTVRKYLKQAMQYVEFTQRQDAETLLHCMVHALEFFKGCRRRC